MFLTCFVIQNLRVTIFLRNFANYYSSLKAIKHIIRGVLWTVIGLYLLLVVLLKIPAIQAFMGNTAASLLTKKLGTEVSVGRVEIGLFNRIIVDDVKMKDQAGKPFFRASRLSAKASIPALLRGKISVSSAQIFGLHADLYKVSADDKPNFQFVLDSLASKDSDKKTPLDLSIYSLVVRHSAISYHRLDLPPTHNRFNAAHIDLSDISAHLVISHLTDSEVDAHIKKLSFREASGLRLKSFEMKLKADKQQALLTDFRLALPQSQLTVDQAEAHYQWLDGKPDSHSLTFNINIPESRITPSDIAPFVPSLKKLNSPLAFSLQAKGNDRRLQIDNLHAQAYNRELTLNVPHLMLAFGSRLKGSATSPPTLSAPATRLSVSKQALEEITKSLHDNGLQLPAAVTRLGSISWKGELGMGTQHLLANGQLETEAGVANLKTETHGALFSAHIQTDGFNIGRVLDNEQLGIVSTDLYADGQWPIETHALNLKGNVSNFYYNGYHYNDLSIDGHYLDKTLTGDFQLDDPNAQLSLNGTIDLSQQEPHVKATASVRQFNPNALGLTKKYEDTFFEADLDANLTGRSLNTANGSLTMNQFTMSSPEGQYSLDRLTLDATSQDGERSLAIDSDFGQVGLRGQYNYASLPESIIHFLSQKLPMLPGLPKSQPTGNNEFSLHANITKSDWLQALLGLDLSLHKPVVIDGFINDWKKQVALDMIAPHFSYNGGQYENALANITTNADGRLVASTSISKLMGNGTLLDIGLEAEAQDNEILTTIAWNDNQPRPMKGSLRSTTELFRNEQGQQSAHIRVHPSEILVNDTVWRVEPSDIVYSKDNLIVDYFAVAHNRQHIIIQGKGTKHASDSLVVELSDVDVNYITNLVNFHSVEFGGKVSGRASVRSAFNNPDAHADIRVNRFTFEDGRMGTLFANVRWNKEEKQIDIDAHADEPEESGYGRTLVKGYISPSKNYIDLALVPQSARAEFLKSFCGSFMDNVEVNVSGDLRLHGDLGAINLTGMAVANGELDISSLNTHYRLTNDTIVLIPNEIIFARDTIRDNRGEIGIVTGALHHKALTRLTYDIDVEAQNLLCYDFRDYGESTFFGTVYGTGTCSIRGRSGTIDFDINVTPEEGSFIEYNAASPDAITNREFITWNSRREDESSRREERSEISDSSISGSEEQGVSSENSIVISKESNLAPHSPLPTPRNEESDLRLNFLINATPECTLRVLMDKESGDYIALNGSGAIRATYYNKGGFDMFGNYQIDHGLYKLTIQNLMKKEFQFQPGSSIVFGGDPYLAALDLKALYTVNGVALSDLQIGRSFSSNNVRVDCLMNIGGTPQQPHVEFDLDMPTVSADAKQMVRQLINSEEEMNQQVIYLLSIGRFYTQNANNAEENQSQTSLAMQSLLSGTISQQINYVLGQWVHSSKWNFGANISTGDEGWNNAEYEGLLSGRLLNNRLLINGQFGYRDNANATTSFIGDFDIRYLLLPNGNLAVKVYNQTNDRYFTRSSLNTQGIGFVMKKDFNSWRELFGWKPAGKAATKKSPSVNGLQGNRKDERLEPVAEE